MSVKIIILFVLILCIVGLGWCMLSRKSYSTYSVAYRNQISYLFPISLTKGELESIEKYSDLLLSIYPDIGGYPLKSICQLVRDGSIPSSFLDSANSIQQNVTLCKESYKNPAHKRRIIRTLTRPWKGDLYIGYSKPELGDGKNLKLAHEACPQIASKFVPQYCQRSGNEKYAPISLFDKYCAAFTFYYDHHYKVINNLTFVVDQFRFSNLSHTDKKKLFQRYYLFFMQYGTYRWNYAKNTDEDLEKLLQTLTTQCEDSHWLFPSDRKSWGHLGYPCSWMVRFIQLMDEAFSQMPGLPHETTVYKGLENDELYFSYAGLFLDKKTGDEFELNGYVSTTLQPEIALAYTCAGVRASLQHSTQESCAIMILKLPQGTQCHYKHDSSNYAYQILLPRKRQFRVLRNEKQYINNANGNPKEFTIIEVELLNPDASGVDSFNDIPISIHALYENPVQTNFHDSYFNQNPVWIQEWYQFYMELTGADAPIIPSDKYETEVQDPSKKTSSVLKFNNWTGAIQAMKELQVVALTSNILDFPPYAEGTQKLQVVHAGIDPTLTNRDSADSKGLVGYLTTEAPLRHAKYGSERVYGYDLITNRPFGNYSFCNPNGLLDPTSVEKPYYCNSGSSVFVGKEVDRFKPRGGHWYSHPEGGKCLPNQKMGEWNSNQRCSWRTEKEYGPITITDLKKHGWKDICDYCDCSSPENRKHCKSSISKIPPIVYGKNTQILQNVMFQ